MLLLASQKFEADYNESSSDNKDKDDDEILLYLSEPFVGSNDAKMMITNNDEELCNKLGEPEANVRYESPKTKEKVVEARKGGIPQKTQDQNKWVANLWCEGAQNRLRVPFVEEEERQYELLEDFCKMSTQAMNFWLAKFILEVRRRDGKSYSGETLYQVCRGLLRLLKEADRAEVNILSNPVFCQFRASLDARMKELKATGQHKVKRAQVITEEQENCLWEKDLLGDQKPQQLLDTLIFYIGLSFALQSGLEHRRLRFYPSQIQVVEPESVRSYIMCTEDVSKTNKGGIAHRRREPKQVIQYANEVHPERCLIRLYKLYVSKCPLDRPNEAFYLKPLARPTNACWYQKTPVGHNILQKTVRRLCESAGFDGHFTNHSLRATIATRLFEAKVDEQLIMHRTGHTSTAVRSYKRVGEKLRAVTSDVLNGRANTMDVKVEKDNKVQAKLQGKPVNVKDENVPPGINVVGASNCTININYNH